MRIIAGSKRGALLKAPAVDAVRPTSDRVREAIFNILAHGIAEFRLEGVRVLDLFAGTGALGLEALSRGAAYAVFIEEDAGARGLIRANIETLGLTGVTKVFRRDATQLGEPGRIEPFGLVFLDPPYGKGLGQQALASARAGRWLTPGAVIVLEERAGSVTTLPAGFTELDRRTWGDTQAVIGRVAGHA